MIKESDVAGFDVSNDPDNYRQVGSEERVLIERLLRNPFPGRDELRVQLNTLTVIEIDERGSLALFSAGDGPSAPVARRIATEAFYEDKDGVRVNILLHVVDGRLNELEIFRDDSQPLQSSPYGQDAIFALLSDS